jgi:hypothetical protein
MGEGGRCCSGAGWDTTGAGWDTTGAGWDTTGANELHYYSILKIFLDFSSLFQLFYLKQIDPTTVILNYCQTPAFWRAIIRLNGSFPRKR